MAITPDDKDWTWVLERPCPECGFDASTVAPPEVADAIVAMLPTWRAVLERDDVTERPSPDRWSALEYGCHVRDVFRICDGRLELMLTEDDATFANWDQDETAIVDRYDLQDPATVADELEVAGRRIASRLADVSGEQWDRPGTRSNGSRFTVGSFALYVLHDPFHHLADVSAS